MNPVDSRIIEEGWAALVERLGLAEATRFIMLLDRRTGGALQHLHAFKIGTPSRPMYHYHAPSTRSTDPAALNYLSNPDTISEHQAETSDTCRSFD
jgi:hypothetical protein